jgi:hypothetical protein
MRRRAERRKLVRASPVKILFSTHTRPDYIPPPQLVADQVICGPNYPDRVVGLRVFSLKTPPGNYDMAAVIQQIPRRQRPDLLIVRSDSSRVNLPRNLSAAGCRAVLVIGDTHHLTQPIQTILAYARAEPFEAVILDFTRQHAHFFVEAGLPLVYWLPGFNVLPVKLPAKVTADIPFSFVGQLGQWHRRRLAICRALSDAKLQLQIAAAPAHVTPLLHGRSRVSLNCSLNGDLNLRVIEVAACGSALLTDRLSPQAGLDLIFADGTEIVTYEDAADCVAKAKSLLGDSAWAGRVAQAGNAAYRDRLSPPRIRKLFFDLVDRGKHAPEFAVAREKRSLRGPCPDPQGLMHRIGLYQYLQEANARRDLTRIVAGATVDRQLLADAADLPCFRLALDLTGDPARLGSFQEFAAREGVEGQIEPLTDRALLHGRAVDLIIATGRDILAPPLVDLLAGNQRPAVLLTDFPAPDAPVRQALIDRGMTQPGAGVPIFVPAQGG